MGVLESANVAGLVVFGTVSSLLAKISEHPVPAVRCIGAAGRRPGSFTGVSVRLQARFLGFSGFFGSRTALG